MAEKSATILVIDDEVPFRRLLRAFLDSLNYRCMEAASREEGFRLAAARCVDLILLDLELPGADGLETERLFAQLRAAPVIAFSASPREQDIVSALDAGAVDYLIKPFLLGELAARIRVALRNFWVPEGMTPPVVLAGDLRIDLAKRRVTRAGSAIHLTPNEFKLLALLARQADKVVPHDRLLAEIWGSRSKKGWHPVRGYIHSLRKKIAPDQTRSGLLQTIPGVGYRLDLE